MPSYPRNYRLVPGAPNLGSFNQTITMPPANSGGGGDDSGACEIVGPVLLGCFNSLLISSDGSVLMFGFYGLSAEDVVHWEFSTEDDFNNFVLGSNYDVPVITVLKQSSGSVTVTATVNGEELPPLTIATTATCNFGTP